jgi:hypothetical protein
LVSDLPSRLTLTQAWKRRFSAEAENGRKDNVSAGVCHSSRLSLAGTPSLLQIKHQHDPENLNQKTNQLDKNNFQDLQWVITSR